LLGERDCGLEHLLHLQGRSDFDADECGLFADVREVVWYSGRDDDNLAGSGDDALASDPKSHCPLDHLEALFLQRMEVQRPGNAGAGRELEVDRHQFAVRLGGGRAEGDPFTADRV
jgi:hypothetical protein